MQQNSPENILSWNLKNKKGKIDWYGGAQNAMPFGI